MYELPNSLCAVHQAKKRLSDPYDDRPATPDPDQLGQFTKISDVRMTNLVAANLYRIDGDYAYPTLCYCRPDAPAYRRVGMGWEMVDGEEPDELEES